MHAEDPDSSSPATGARLDGRVDGRRMRSAESRARVTEALYELVREGEVDPSAEQVARRAGVGLRTVFRLFRDKENLLEQIAEAIANRLAESARPPLKGETWRERLDDAIDRRTTMFEEILPYRRAGVVHAHRSQPIRARQAQFARAMRDQLEHALPADLRTDRELMEALDGALWVDVWVRLRVDQGQDAAAARAIFKRMARSLLADAAGA